MTEAARTTIPVLLSGGIGSRLWPMSREHFPKQLLPLTGQISMLQQTAMRFTDGARFAPPMVVTNETLRFVVAEQMRAAGIPPHALLLEPVARNTAPAVAAAALFAARTDPDAILLVTPSDHQIRDAAGLADLVERARPCARDGYLVTFSVPPSRPETGYGYIRRGAPLAGRTDVYAVAQFIEKPDSERARALMEQGDYFWNSGMVLVSARHILAELEQWAPDVLNAARRAVANASTDHDFVRLDADAFASAPSISIDHAVMEHTQQAATVPCDVGWSDLGAWNEIWMGADKDAGGNAWAGDVIVDGARDCYARSEGPLTILLGVANLVVVVTDDAVLVAGRAHAQEVKRIAEQLKAAGRSEATTHSRVYRPWGFYQSVHDGDRFQVKRLTVNPGARLSLQKHYHRAEHWVVVHGTALVTRDGETRMVRENESAYIPAGAVHRLENPGKVPLHLIEVQSGSYLGEDDIVRVEDTYGRA